MINCVHRLLKLCVAAACLVLTQAAIAQQATSFDTSADNLPAVLRESEGGNKRDESLQPFGKISARMPDGRRIEFDASWYQYLGDMHVRTKR